MMIFDDFENFQFLKIFDPQMQIVKNSPRDAEISAHLKNHKNSTSKCKRNFCDPRATFLIHFDFCSALRLKFQPKILVTCGPYREKFWPIYGFWGSVKLTNFTGGHPWIGSSSTPKLLG